MLRDWVEGLYDKLSQKWARTSEVFHYNLFELRDGQLYFRDKSKPLTTIEGKLQDLDLNVPKGKVTARQALILNEAEEEMPSASDIDKAGDIELQEIAKSMENLISQMSQTDNSVEGGETLPMRELLGLDKQQASRKSIASSRNSESILESMTMKC